MESLIEKMIDNIESSKFMETIRLESIDNNSSILETTLNPPIKLDPTKHYLFIYLFIYLTNNIFVTLIKMHDFKATLQKKKYI